MQHSITITTLTDPGRVRERNEDNVFAEVRGDMALLIVADGMGGYRAGDLASELAITTIRSELELLFAPSTTQPTIKLQPKNNSDDDRSTIVLPETPASQHYGTFLTQSVRQANRVIIDYGKQHREATGLGSTVTIVLVVRNRAYFANVGDSRSYLLHNGTLRAITRDHSLVAKLVEAGELEPDAIYEHPKRNLIYRSLGSEGERGDLEVDLFEEELFDGDLVLLCSDGLWEKVRAPEITAALTNEQDLDAACHRLIDTANANGGEDNITIALARYHAIQSALSPSDVDTKELPMAPR
jgi:PPM family protein phosphatase